jgi:hypothetical protein
MSDLSLHGLRHALGYAGDVLFRRYVSHSSPIIVGGCGRSGTTLVRVILDSHPALCCGPESGLLVRRRPDEERLRILAARFDLDPEAVLGDWRAARDHGEFVDRFFGAYARARGRARWAEKTPKNVAALGWIFRRFPEARFIHMIRDGRDVVCSLRTHPRFAWVDGKQVPTGIRRPIRECIARWRDDVRAGLRYRGDPRTVELRYEDVIAEPEPTLRKLFEFLGEPWDDAVLRFYEVEGGSRDVRRFPQNPEATQPIRPDAGGRWRRDLAPDEVGLFKQLAGSLLVELGYERDQNWDSAA